MNKGITSVLLLSVLTSMTINAADTSSINVKGNVVASPCVIDAENSVINVDLKDIQAASLAEAGSSSEWKMFDIVLKNCPVSTSNINVKFTGAVDGADPKRYKNTGTANNIGIELLGIGGMDFVNNPVAMSFPVDKATNTASFTLKTRVYSVLGGVMPGSINAGIVATFTYR